MLYSIPPKHHIQICINELEGLRKLGINCQPFVYGNNSNSNIFSKLFLTLFKAFNLVLKSWKTKPSHIYFNSRIEKNAFVRDYITIHLLKLLYPFKVKIIYKSHGSDVSVFENYSMMNKSLTTYLKKQIDFWFILSKNEFKNLSKYIDQHKIGIAKNIICPPAISKKTNEVTNNKAEVKFKILYAGRLIKAKGVYEIIESIKNFKYREQTLFIFAGDGPEKQNLTETINRNKISNVQFLGNISESELAELYNNVDILLFPSHDEGFSMVLFNSVASGLPVITTKIRAAEDYLKEPDNVLWVEINNPEMIAIKLNTLFEDSKLRADMSKNNRELYNMFNQETVCSEIYRNIISI